MRGGICRESSPVEDDRVVSEERMHGKRVVGFDVDIQCLKTVKDRNKRIVELLGQACEELEKLAKDRLRLKMSEGRAIGVGRELKDLIRVLCEESC